MLSVTNIARSYGDHQVLDGITFTLGPGERAGLIGPNGAGKSTLLRIISGQETADRGAVWLDPHARLGYLAQALPFVPGATVGDVISEATGPTLALLDEIERLAGQLATASGAAYDAALERYGAALDEAERLDAYGAPARLAAVLAGLGLAHLAAQTPVAILSGGQKTRLGLARLLLTRPDILLLDEPTNHLDITALRWLEAFIQGYQGAVLVVAHDRAFLDAVVTRILALNPITHTLRDFVGTYTEYAETVEQERGRYADAFRRQQERIAAIEADIGGLKERARQRELTTIDFALRKKAQRGARTAKVRERKLERLLASEEHLDKPQRAWGLQLHFGDAPPSGQRVLTLEGVSKAFAGQVLFAGVDAEIRQGERIALLGPNGSGKTTLLRLITGQLAPDSGQVRLGAGVRPGYFAQEGEGLDPRQTVLEAVRAVAPLSETAARTFLHLFLFGSETVFTLVERLSWGERARLVLARLVLSGVNFLILDEPLNHLDIAARQEFEAALAAFDGTVLAVAHDRYFVAHFAQRLWALDAGQLRFYFDLAEYERAAG